MMLLEKLPPHRKIQVLLQIQPQFVVKQKVSAALMQSFPKIDTSIVYLHSHLILDYSSHFSLLNRSINPSLQFVNIIVNKLTK